MKGLQASTATLWSQMFEISVQRSRPMDVYLDTHSQQPVIRARGREEGGQD